MSDYVAAMKSKSTSIEEMEYLRARSAFIMEFIASKDVGNPLYEQVMQIIQNAFDKKNMSGLKSLSRDVNEWAGGLPRKDIAELEALLEEKYGEDLSGDKITLATLRLILKRGKIENEEEYRIVHELLNDISTSHPYYQNKVEFEALLISYEGPFEG
ncbi:MAG: hypothetical protein H7X70_07135 [Candidatus Kapabacteria bacterium]|nr:hypothetical protein [Candidatus Kapabacteria bacterium]